MKVALLGRWGYIGSQFLKELEAREIPTFTIPRDRYTYGDIRQLLKEDKPLLVINCAAYTATGGVDNCEKDKAQTLQANLLLPQTLVHACELTKTPLMHISTACLYQGDKDGQGWTEDDQPQLTINSGAGIYVSSKQMAEEVVRQYDRAYICRVRLPFDEFDHPRNLLTKLQKFDTVVDETQSLCHRGDLVKACLDLWQIRGDYGIYNVTNPGAVNYRELCDKLNARIWHGRRGFNFVSPEWFDENAARTIKSRCVLSSDKLRAAGVRLRYVDDAIDDAIEKWTTQ